MFDQYGIKVSLAALFNIDDCFAKFVGSRLGPSRERWTFSEGSGYGYGTVPGGRWTIDTEGDHVVVSVSLILNGYEYGTILIGAELFIRKTVMW